MEPYGAIAPSLYLRVISVGLRGLYWVLQVFLQLFFEGWLILGWGKHTFTHQCDELVNLDLPREQDRYEQGVPFCRYELRLREDI